MKSKKTARKEVLPDWFKKEETAVECDDEFEKDRVSFLAELQGVK